ncbi:hypothetical protein TREES_T100006450 [Tupaia chinensis]|uniref:Uncharacterized protein n=1 Tax=Tupaia chinensis TaxID=246437 RepID=L9KVL0_TUPCH|nr:hypothetical protein TREES_T100006450 [Tupaia chinensis]
MQPALGVLKATWQSLGTQTPSRSPNQGTASPPNAQESACPGCPCPAHLGLPLLVQASRAWYECPISTLSPSLGSREQCFVEAVRARGQPRPAGQQLEESWAAALIL